MSARVFGGTLKPACSAMNVAALPTSFGFGSRCGVTSTVASLSASAGDMKYAPCCVNWRFTSSATAASTTTEFGDEHSTPLSKHLPTRMSLAAFARSADFSMKHGALPGPTP